MKGKKTKILFLLALIVIVVIVAAWLDNIFFSENGGVSEKEAAIARKQYETERLVSRNESYPLCNDRNLYVWKDDKGIEQRTLSGKLIKTYPFSGECDICYVNNEEVFIIRYMEDEQENELWLVPISKTDSGAEELEMDKAEKIFTENILADYFFANQNVISYCDSDFIYKEYDRKKKKMIPIDNKDKTKNYCSLALQNFAETLSSDTILLHDEEEQYIYAHKIASGTVTKLEAAPTEDDSEGVLSLSACIGNYMFYAEQSTGYTPSDIRLYRCDTGKKTTFLTTEDIEQAAEEAGLSASYEGISSLYTDGNTLYINLYVGDDGDTALLHCKITEKPKLICNKKMNSYEEEQEIIGVVENKLLLSYSVDKDETIYGIYDMAEQRYTETEKEDEKGYYFFYRHDTQEDMLY